MTTIHELITELEKVAPLSFQEAYDNCGLIVGNREATLVNILVSLDCTESIIDEALSKNCNLIISHHPIIFKGLKKITGKTYVERVLIKALKNDIAIYALHTNLDNVLNQGVNSKIAQKLTLSKPKILSPKYEKLAKLITFVPNEHAESVRKALFESGAGYIGNYSNCSFSTQGIGTFKGNEQSQPYVGHVNQIHNETETRIESIFPLYLKNEIISNLLKVHPYEEVAYDIVPLHNTWQNVGSGIIGELQNEMAPTDFLNFLKTNLKLNVIKFTAFDKPIKSIAICGGSGSFLLSDAIQAKADVFITSDFKYHEYFDAEDKLMICDVGHYESEQFTPELIIEIIKDKFANFAPILAETNTNPINYYY